MTVPRRLFFAAQQRIAVTYSRSLISVKRCAVQRGEGISKKNSEMSCNFGEIIKKTIFDEPGAAGASRLSREAAASISQIIVTLTLLLASAGPTSGFLAYSCGNMRSAVGSYAITPKEGCWMRPFPHSAPEPRDGRILWMRDGVRFPVINCKMTETVMQVDCDPGGKVRPWKVIAVERQVPIGPMSCMEISVSRKATLFNRTMALAVIGTAVDTLEERINYDSRGHCPNRRSPGTTGEAYARLTVGKIVVWKREATESLIKKSITRGKNNVLPNFVAGGMDAMEGTYVWNYTMRNCPEEDLEELYSGRLGVLEGRTVELGGTSEGQRAWLRIEKGVTICGRRMRQTHLPHVYVEWADTGRVKESTKQYTAPWEERELEILRLEWSYLEGRDGYKLRRDIQETMTTGCWMEGALADLRLLHVAGQEGTGSIARRFGRGHLMLRSGGVAYVARCGMVVVELRNQTVCKQEIPVTFRGEEMYVDPFSLVLPCSATWVKCRKETPPRWRIGQEWLCGYPEIQRCNGPEPLPSHRQGELMNVAGVIGSDPEEVTIEAQPESEEEGKLSQETLDALVKGVGDRWMEGYGNLGSATAVVGAAMMGVSTMEMVTSTIIRMTVLYAQKGPGVWMMAALWGTAFQIAIMPTRWALEWGETQGKAVSRRILARVGGANFHADRGGAATLN